jgi:hypothetical protein
MENLFPTTGVPVTLGARLNRKVKFGKSWVFDFDEGEFRTTPTGKVEEADEVVAYYEWCQKALLTIRYRHVIYSSDYGSELDTLFRSALSRAAIESEIARMVTETLMVDPRTGTVGDFVFTWLEDNVAFDCQVVTAKGVQLQFSGNTDMAL